MMNFYFVYYKQPNYSMLVVWMVSYLIGGFYLALFVRWFCKEILFCT